MEVEVIKLGGSILKNRDAFVRATNIVESELDQCRIPICIVSAINGVTDAIIKAVDDSLKDPLYEPRLFVERLFEHHLSFIPLKKDASKELENEFEKLLHVMYYIKSSDELCDSVYAYAVSRGENFSSTILSQFLDDRGIPSKCFYGEDLMVTDENHREAAVNLASTKRKLEEVLLPEIRQNIVPIIAGFAGRSKSGKVTIFGRGGTDDTAVNVAYGLGVKKTIKYVMEEGIMTLDPHFLDDFKSSRGDLDIKFKIPQPRVVPYLSYVEASELLREERTKVVHYKVLDPLMKGKIELRIKNYFDEGSQGTIIGVHESTNNEPRPKAISYQRNLRGVRFLPSQSVPPSEVYSTVFSKLSEEEVDVRYVSTSGYQMSFLMPEKDQEKAVNALSSLDIALDVSPMPGSKGTFSVIGSEMRGMKGFLSRLSGVLARNGVNIEQATQPNSENIIRFSIDDEDIPLAVVAVYTEFFKDEVE
jgi:aspartate kinase